jgi:hypothetical protein
MSREKAGLARGQVAAMPGWLRISGSDVAVDVVVVPRSSRNRVVGVHDNRLKIQLTSPPVEGRANAALVDLVAKLVGVARAHVQVVAGTTSRRKTVQIASVPLQRALLALAPHAD